MTASAHHRCRCGKAVFRDRIAAEIALANAARRNNSNRREVRAYRCEYRKWHITSRDMWSAP